MKLHAEVETKNAERLQEDWKAQVSIPSKYDAQRYLMLEIISNFSHMWDRNLGRIMVTKYFI